ncbi:uncharacterized [Tachysurus ichikawai]
MQAASLPRERMAQRTTVAIVSGDTVSGAFSRVATKNKTDLKVFSCPLSIQNQGFSKEGPDEQEQGNPERAVR